jgi:hypothetical protein
LIREGNPWESSSQKLDRAQEIESSPVFSKPSPDKASQCLYHFLVLAAESELLGDESMNL